MNPHAPQARRFQVVLQTPEGADVLRKSAAPADYFLDDPTQKPHLIMSEVDKAFGVSSGTGQGRSKTIRDRLKIGSFDPEWTLPSRMARKPMVWLIQVNGIIVDARALPREIQEEAFRQGRIPYVPGEQEADQDED